MKKRICTCLIALALLLSLGACGQGDIDPVSSTAAQTETDTRPEADISPDTSPDTNTDTDLRALVVYFSRTGENYTVGEISHGNTAILGEIIAEETGADVFEIVPVTPYPDSYDACLDVATQEMQDKARPAYTGSVDVWDAYDIVFFGYPIWWGDMPMIAYSFLEDHDWTGKTLIPFNTHEGSGQSGTQSTIATLCPEAQLLPGLAIRGNTAQNDPDATRQAVQDWLSEMPFFT